MPTARHPRIFASCPTAEPTAPAAAETTTVSPAFGAPRSYSPTYAVTPGIPAAPRYAEAGTRETSTLRRPAPSDVAHSCQPREPTTASPAAKRGFRDSTTSPTVPPTITPPTGTGVAYDSASTRRRMYG